MPAERLRERESELLVASGLTSLFAERFVPMQRVMEGLCVRFA